MVHVSEGYEARVQTSRERMRLSQVRKSFDAGLKQKESGTDIPEAFFGASVTYIKAAMDRLHDQDQRIHDFLKPHVTDGDDQNATLENLDMRLAKSRDALDALVAAAAAYKAAGEDGWDTFKLAVEAFMEVYFKILLSGQHSTLTLQEEVFDEAIWDQVAGVTPDSLATEEELYTTVQGLAPDHADPASFVGGPPAPGAGPPGQQGKRPGS
ncbi:MAG: hypothetical protein GKS03_12875 [Alphaproteobacteria bacterium]|nr:hypothetical protein [Alphaproteobacteria bacterium]